MHMVSQMSKLDNMTLTQDIRTLLDLLDSVNCDKDCPLESDTCDFFCQKAINFVAEHDEKIRQQERKLVLDEIVRDRNKMGGRTDGFEYYIVGIEFLESLRSVRRR